MCNESIFERGWGCTVASGKKDWMQVNSSSADFFPAVKAHWKWGFLLHIMCFTMKECRMVSGLLVMLCTSLQQGTDRLWVSKLSLWYQFCASHYFLIVWERQSRSVALAPHKGGVQRTKASNWVHGKRVWKACVAKQVWLLEFPSFPKKKRTAKWQSMKSEVKIWVLPNRNFLFPSAVLLLKLCEEKPHFLPKTCFMLTEFLLKVSISCKCAQSANNFTFRGCPTVQLCWGCTLTF